VQFTTQPFPAGFVRLFPPVNAGDQVIEFDKITLDPCLKTCTIPACIHLLFRSFPLSKFLHGKEDKSLHRKTRWNAFYDGYAQQQQAYIDFRRLEDGIRWERE